MKIRIRSLLRTAFAIYFLLNILFVPVLAENDEGSDDHHSIDEITVTASPLRRTVDQLAQPTSVMDGDELARKAAASIGETVSGELGVSSTYFGPIASRPVIRGQFGERVQVLSNRLDALDASALSEDHQTSVDGILAKRIEIVRGPATLLYGSGASGGLVNVVDRRIIEERLDQSIAGALAINADTAMDERAAAGWLQLGNHSLAAHLDYFARDTGNVEIPAFAESARLRALEGDGADEAFGVIENSASETDGGAAGLTWLGNSGFVGVSISAFDSLYGVPGHHEEEPGAEAGEPVRIDLDQTRIDLAAEYRPARIFEVVRVRLARNEYEHTELEGVEVGTAFDTDGTDLRLEFVRKDTGRWQGTFGLQYMNVDFAAFGDEAFVPPSKTEKTSVFLFEEFAVNEAFALQGSIRLEHQSIDGSQLPMSYDDTALGASIGAVWSASDAQSLSTNISITERHPNATELYADGPHVAVQRFERGSQTQGIGTFGKETSSNIDITWRGNTERVDWTITGFINRIDDFIGLLPTIVEEDGLPVFEYAQFDADFWGVEAEARIELVDMNRTHVHTRIFGDLVIARESNGAKSNLPRIPPLRYGLELHYTFDSLDFGITALVVDQQDRIAAGELPTDRYTLLTADASYRLPEKDLYVFLRGSNLTDRDARQHTSPLKELVPLPGRSIHAGLRWQF